MYGVSGGYLEAAASKVRRDGISGTLRLADGSRIEISDENLVRDTMKLSRELCGGKYRIGTFDLSCLRFGIFLDNALGIDLSGATADITYRLGTEGDSFESVPLGHFLVDPVLSFRRKDILNIVAYDCGVLFDKEPSETLRQLNGTPAKLIIAACEECGVETDIEADSLDAMPNSALSVNAGEKQIQTCRDIVMWCAALLCGYAVIDRSGRLTVISAKYGVSSGNSSVISTDREITAAERESIYVTDTRAYIKYLTAYVGNDVVNYTSEYVSSDEQAAPAAYALEKNPLLAGCSDSVCDNANRAWLAYIDAFKQRGVSARIFGDPAIDPGDTVLFSGGDVDQRAGIIGVVTSYVWNYRGYQDIECLAAECIGSLVSSGGEGASGGTRSPVRSQLSKRMDALSGGSGGVGEYLDDGHTCERFNDYRAHTFNETTQKWTGGNWSDKIYDHIEGFGNKVIDTRGRVHSTSYPGYNHVEGYENYVETTDGYGPYCHVEGYRNKLKNGFAMHVGGMNNTVEGGNSGLVHGRNNTVKGLFCGIVSGEYNTVGTAENSSISHVGVFGNNCVINRSYCVAIGSSLDIGQYESYYLVVGDHARNGDHPPFAVDGNGNIYGRMLHLTDYAYAAGFNTPGADYAEYFEWLDGNPDNDDRCGMLVALCGDKLVPAHGDEIFGIISAAPSVVGNAYEQHWHGKYARDIYGRILLDGNGEKLLAPGFDSGREYVPRSKRPEWAAVGITGRLVINDDGSCKPGGYVSARRGVGTSCFGNTGVRVLCRIDENHVEVMIK